MISYFVWNVSQSKNNWAGYVQKCLVVFMCSVVVNETWLCSSFSKNTYLLTPRCRVLLEKLTGLQPVKKFPAFHGTRRFITALTSVRHLLSPEQASRMWVFLNKDFYREGLLAPRPTPKMEDHPSSAVRDCLFNLFAATLLIGGRSEKYSSFKFHENQFSGSRLVSCGQTDRRTHMTKLIVAFRNFTNASNNAWPFYSRNPSCKWGFDIGGGAWLKSAFKS